MNPDFPTLLIAAVFAAQILVVSFIAPLMLYRRWQVLREKYPPRDYPRLYPIAPQKLARQNAVLHSLHISIGIAAAATLVTCLVLGYDALHLARVMIWTCMVQFVPPLLRMPLLLRMYRAARAMPAPAMRSVELRHWRFADFVSPAEIVLGITASVLALVCSAYFYLHGPGHMTRLLVFSAVVSGLLMLRIVFLLSGSATMRRPDPYMSEEDVIRGRRLRYRLVVRMAMLLGLYFTFLQLYAAGKLRLDFSHVMAAASILGQLVYLGAARLALRALDARDFGAYRNTPETGAKKEEAAASP